MTFEHASMSFVNPLTAMAMLDLAQRNGAKAIILNAAASALGRMTNRLLAPEKIDVVNIVRR
jgi:NADPH:quinone reductase-like Zn-dependent oxidoreductase